MRKLIVAVSCGFEGYEPFTARSCAYNHAQSVACARRVLDVVQLHCGGKAAFLIHTSPFVRRNHNDVFYTSRDYLSIWAEAVAGGGEVGLHTHEEEPDGSCLYYGYREHIERVVSSHVKMLGDVGLSAVCQATGYSGLNEWFLPVLKANDILVNFDNIGEFTQFTARDWSSAPIRPFIMDEDDMTVEGNSGVLSVPLGMTEFCRGLNGLMLGTNDLRYLKSLWREIASGDSACFLWVDAHRIESAGRKLVSLLKWLKSEGVSLATPTEVYRDAVYK